MPELPMPPTHHWLKDAFMVADLSGTSKWEHHEGTTQYIMADSGSIMTVFKRVVIDTFKLDFSPCVALDTIHLWWARTLAETVDGRVKADIFCDSLNNRIGIVEQIIESEGTYQRLIRANRIVNGINVQLICNTTQPIAMGPSPPEMRLRVLRWMSDIRAVEQ